MEKNERRYGREEIISGVNSADTRLLVYTAIFLVLLAVTLIIAVRDNRREIFVEEDLDYPVAYSAVFGSDAQVSHSDVAERADSYLAQFREFDRTYCYEYWMQCQNILAEDPGYAPDEELTAQAREDYRHYVFVVRSEREADRALREKLVLCVAVGGLTLMSGGLLAVNRLKRFLLIQKLNACSAEEWAEDDLPYPIGKMKEE